MKKEAETLKKFVREAVVELTRKIRENEESDMDFPTIEEITSYIHQRGYKLASPKRKRDLEHKVIKAYNRNKDRWALGVNSINIVPIRTKPTFQIIGLRHIQKNECTELIVEEKNYKDLRATRETKSSTQYIVIQQKIHIGFRRLKFPAGHPKHISETQVLSLLN